MPLKRRNTEFLRFNASATIINFISFPVDLVDVDPFVARGWGDSGDDPSVAAEVAVASGIFAADVSGVAVFVFSFYPLFPMNVS